MTADIEGRKERQRQTDLLPPDHWTFQFIRQMQAESKTEQQINRFAAEQMIALGGLDQTQE